MAVRAPLVAGMFYPKDAASCRQQIDDLMQNIPPRNDLTLPIHAGLVPHAGWVYSGRTAAHVFAALQNAPLDTLILLGAVHRWGIETASLYGSGRWRTPLGQASVDEELAKEVIVQSEGLVVDRPSAHEGEHSIEVQVPFIQHLFPEAQILPVAVPPIANAHLIGHVVAQAVQTSGRRAVAIASSDLTHYGPRYGMAPAGAGTLALAWIERNDHLILDLAASMSETEIVAHVRDHRNACGAGALAAAIGYALEEKATQGTLLHYTTSYTVIPTTPATDMVGYGAMVFS